MTSSILLAAAHQGQDTRPGPRHVPRVLLATDLGPSSAAATEAAIRLARDLDGSLLVVSVIEPGRPAGFGTRIDQLRERRERDVRQVAEAARASGVAAAFLVWQGEPGPSLVAAAESEAADFIVLGSNQRPRVSRLLLGSTSDHVLRSAPCPVVIVRPDDDEAPERPPRTDG